MTISTTQNKVIGQGNGVTTSWPFAFVIPNASSIVVIYTDSAGNQTILNPSQYAVTGIGNTAGGAVTYPLTGSPIATGASLTIERVVPLSQTASLTNQAGYYPNVVEGALDSLEMQIQQISERQSSSIQFPVVDPPGNSQGQLPAWQQRANNFLGFDANGNPVAAAVPGGTGVTLASLQSLTLSQGVSLVGGAARMVDSIATLKTVPKTSNSRVFVTGYYAPGDGGGGAYWYDSSDTTSTDNGGTIIVAADSGRWKLVATGMVSLLQFGAHNDNTNLSATTAAIQAAVTWANSVAKALYAPSGTYGINDTIIKASSFIGVSIFGEGPRGTMFDYSTIASGKACLQIVGSSGGWSGGRIYGISFDGNANSIGIEICGQDGQCAENCNFVTNAVGIKFHNRDGGMFTEYCRAIRCAFVGPIKTAIQYSRTSGDKSFNGTGVIDCTANSNGTDPVILIDDGAMPYNAPLSMQVWGSGTLIQNNDNQATRQNINFHGTITIENGGAPNLKLCNFAHAGSRCIFVGDIISAGEYFDIGDLQWMENFYLISNGANAGTPRGMSYTHALVQGANSLPLVYIGAPGIFQLDITGANYQYSYLYAISANRNISPYVFPVQLANTIAFNTAGWGACTFGAVSGAAYSEVLAITNNSVGFAATATVTWLQVGMTVPNIPSH